MHSRVVGEDPTDDSDYGESEDNDENFTMRKSKVKEIKKRGVKAKSPGGKKEKGKKEKKSKSKCNASGELAPNYLMLMLSGRLGFVWHVCSIRLNLACAPCEFKCVQGSRRARQGQNAESRSLAPGSCAWSFTSHSLPLLALAEQLNHLRFENFKSAV